MLPKFLLLREVSLRLERVWNTMLTRSQRGPPYYPHALTNARCRESTIGVLKVHTKPLQQGWGELHNSIGGSQHCHEASPQWMWLRGLHKLLDAPSTQEYQGLLGSNKLTNEMGICLDGSVDRVIL